MERTLTVWDMMQAQKRGQEKIDAANAWSEAAREASAISRHEHMMEAQHDPTAKKWKLKSGEDLPSHSPKNIPPAWKNVKVNSDPNGKVQASGRGRRRTGADAAGRD
jgi:DNA topoisomerase IB